MNDIEKVINVVERQKRCATTTVFNQNYDIIIKALKLMQKQEQGLVIELPCKVGDKLYNVVLHKIGEDIYDNQIHTGIIEEIRVNIFCDGGIYSCSLNDIGKTVFLAKEEAEQKLNELNGELVNE